MAIVAKVFEFFWVVNLSARSKHLENFIHILECEVLDPLTMLESDIVLHGMLTQIVGFGVKLLSYLITCSF